MCMSVGQGPFEKLSRAIELNDKELIEHLTELIGSCPDEIIAEFNEEVLAVYEKKRGFKKSEVQAIWLVVDTCNL